MRHAGSLIALGIVISASVGLLIEPELFTELYAKEGLAEHISHSVVAVAAVGWCVLGRWRPGALFGALFFLIVLGEETDWGGVYGVGEGYNLHNALGGHLYTIFALPLVLFYGASLVARRRLRALVGAAMPERFDRWVLFLCALFGPVAGISVMAVHERALDEAIELAIYMQCAWLGLVGVVVDLQQSGLSRPLAERSRRRALGSGSSASGS